MDSWRKYIGFSFFKNQNSINGIVYSKYTANVNFFNGSKETLLVKNDELGSKESLRGSKETLPNNNIYNNIYNNETQIFEKEFDLPKKQTKQKKEIKITSFFKLAKI